MSFALEEAKLCPRNSLLIHTVLALFAFATIPRLTVLPDMTSPCNRMEHLWKSIIPLLAHDKVPAKNAMEVSPRLHESHIRCIYLGK